MLARLLISALVVLLSVGPAVQAQERPSLSSLKDRYERLEALQASFTQVTTSEFTADSSRVRGQVVLAGTKYRVETPAQTVVTNGQTTWIYSPADSQVVVNDAESAESTLTPQSFLASSTNYYTVDSHRSSRRDGTPHTVLVLSSTDEASRFSDVTLWVRSSDRIVTRLQATDRNGSIIDLRLSGIRVNPTFSGTPFVFSPPDGVEVVDLRTDDAG